MRKFVVCFLLLSLLTLSALLAVPGAPPALQSTKTDRQPTGQYSPANWTTNRITNPGFEDWTSPTNAEEWSETTSGETDIWYAEAPEPVKSGTRSIGFSAKSSPTGNVIVNYVSASSSLQSNMGKLNLTFDWYSDQIQNNGSDTFFVGVGVYDVTGPHLITYYLNGTSQGAANHSYAAYFDLGGPVQTWNRFSRNLTADYEAVAEFPSLTPAAYIFFLRFILYSFPDTPQVNQAYLDNVVLENDTTTWINSTVHDGGFETGESWEFNLGTENSYISRSTTAHSGSSSCNITAQSSLHISQASLSIFPYTRITALNPGNISFWWCLDYENLAQNSYASLDIGFYNGTGYQNLNYYFCSGGGTFGITNSSTGLYLHVEELNTSGSWVYFHRDIWAEAGAYFGVDELYISSVYFRVLNVENLSGDSRITFLLDDVEQISGAVNGAGFEDQQAVDSRVRGWGSAYAAYDRLRVTDTAYAGSKAANLTLPTSGTVSVSQNLRSRPIRGSRNTSLDLAWRLDDFSVTSNDYARIYVYFGNYKYLYYYFGLRSGELPDNTSSSGYFNVTGVNTLGTWHLLHRNLSSDYAAVFGTRPNTTLTYLYLSARTYGADRLVLLIDDLYLYDTDDTPPINPWLLLFPVFVAVIVIIVVVLVVLFVVIVWQRGRKR